MALISTIRPVTYSLPVSLFLTNGNMSFQRFVEIGRVVYIGVGPDQGKLAVIVDVIDQNRVLIDGPRSGVNRKQLNLKYAQLTKFVLPLHQSARAGTVIKAWEKADITTQWNESTWAKKIAAREKRAQLSDFDRFKLMKAKQARNRLINIQFGKLRNAQKKNPVTSRKPNKKQHKK